MKNKKESKVRRTSKLAEHIKTAVMAVLLISLVVLVVVYISGMRLDRAGSQLNEGLDRLWSPQSGMAPEGLEKTRLIPELVGFKEPSGESAVAAFADANALWELYEIVNPCLLELFGEGYVCRPLTGADGAAVFSAACESKEFVYIRYHTPVLYQLIYAYASGDPTIVETDVATGQNGNVGAYVSELFVLPEENGTANRFVAYAADGDGNYYEFKPGEGAASSKFYISDLSAGAQGLTTVDFKFAFDDRFLTPEPLVCDEIEVIHFTRTDITLGEDEQNKLLTLFGYNLDKLDRYSDENGYVYIDSHSRLRFNGGYISFTTDDTAGTSSSLRGVRIASLLGYTGADAATGLFDKLTAADNLIRRLGDISPSLIGAMGQLCLGDVYSDGGRLVVEYFLTFNGVRIGTEPHFRAVFTEQTICEVSVYSATLEISPVTDLIPSAQFALDGLLSPDMLSGGKRISRMRLAHTDGGPKWSVIFN